MDKTPHGFGTHSAYAFVGIVLLGLGAYGWVGYLIMNWGK